MAKPVAVAVSVLWPKLLADLEAAQDLVDRPGYSKLLAEWQDQVRDLLDRLERSAENMERVQFIRGQLAQLRMNLGFPEDLAAWKKNLNERK